MEDTDIIHLLAGLSEERCELNHGPDTADTPIPASDYIVIPMGDKAEDKAARELVIPVCSECAEALMQDEWVLVYCLDCGGSHWINKELAKNKYRHHILWLKGCPSCSGEFGGIWFSDSTDHEHKLTFLDHAA